MRCEIDSDQALNCYIFADRADLLGRLGRRGRGREETEAVGLDYPKLRFSSGVKVDLPAVAFERAPKRPIERPPPFHSGWQPSLFAALKAKAGGRVGLSKAALWLRS